MMRLYALIHFIYPWKLLKIKLSDNHGSSLKVMSQRLPSNDNLRFRSWVNDHKASIKLSWYILSHGHKLSWHVILLIDGTYLTPIPLSQKASKPFLVVSTTWKHYHDIPLLLSSRRAGQSNLFKQFWYVKQGRTTPRLFDQRCHLL